MLPTTNKVAHFVTLGTPDDLDDLVCGWIDEAFRENGRNTEDGGWRNKGLGY